MAPVHRRTARLAGRSGHRRSMRRMLCGLAEAVALFAGAIGTGITTTGLAATTDTVTVVANPPTVSATGTATAAITATVRTGSGALVGGDTVDVTASGTACGTLAPASATTGSTTGQAQVTYTASTAAGTCTITATELDQRQSGTAAITQATQEIAVVASPMTLRGDGSSTATISATVTNPAGTAVLGDPVDFTAGGTACGTLAPASATTGNLGQAFTTYTASTAAGTCTIIATDIDLREAGSTTITQTTPGVAVVASPASLGANGSSTATITATVTNPIGAPVLGDPVYFTTSGSACGTFSSASATTNSLGQALTTYTASTAAGTCTITAAEIDLRQSGSTTITQTPIVALVAGYWVATADGHVFPFGTARFLGSPISHGRHGGDVVGMAAGPGGDGYWVVTASGHVYQFGSARFHGSPASRRIEVRNVVGIAASRGSTGYWVATRDGHVYQFGTARFLGSPVADRARTGDVVGLTATPDGLGYWVATRDGHVYQFGSARFEGSPIRQRLRLTDFAGLAGTRSGLGYWVFTADGQIFPYGRASREGTLSAPGIPPTHVVGMAGTPDSQGYWIATAAGQVYPYGNAADDGSPFRHGVTLTDAVALVRQ